MFNAIGYIVAGLSVIGLSIYSYYLKSKIMSINDSSSIINQDNARIVAAENILDVRQTTEAINAKNHAAETDATTLLNELHSTGTSRTSKSPV